MTIDLRGLIPFVAPFLGIVLARALVWFAGFEWSDSDAFAFLLIFASTISLVGGDCNRCHHVCRAHRDRQDQDRGAA